MILSRRPISLTKAPVHVTTSGAQSLRLVREVLDVKALTLVLRVLSLQGGAGKQIAVKIETGMQADSDAGWVELGTFSNQTSAPASETIDLTGLLRYIRYSVTLPAGTNATFTVDGMASLSKCAIHAARAAAAARAEAAAVAERERALSDSPREPSCSCKGGDQKGCDCKSSSGGSKQPSRDRAFFAKHKSPSPARSAPSRSQRSDGGIAPLRDISPYGTTAEIMPGPAGMGGHAVGVGGRLGVGRYQRVRGEPHLAPRMTPANASPPGQLPPHDAARHAASLLQQDGLVAWQQAGDFWKPFGDWWHHLKDLVALRKCELSGCPEPNKCCPAPWGGYTCASTTWDPLFCDDCKGCPFSSQICMFGECADPCDTDNDCIVPFSFCLEAWDGGPKGCVNIECDSNGLCPPIGMCCSGWCVDPGGLANCGTCGNQVDCSGANPNYTCIASGCCEVLGTHMPVHGYTAKGMTAWFCECQDPTHPGKQMKQQTAVLPDELCP